MSPLYGEESNALARLQLSSNVAVTRSTVVAKQGTVCGGVVWHVRACSSSAIWQRYCIVAIEESDCHEKRWLVTNAVLLTVGALQVGISNGHHPPSRLLFPHHKPWNALQYQERVN